MKNMKPKPLFALIVAVVSGSLLAMSALTHAQSAGVRPLITQPIDERHLVVLHGNTHPLARAEFDRGAAPGDLPMDRMLLVLKRSPQQEAALEKLMAEQQDKSSPNFHKWLTPEEFGQQFGPSDQDIQAVTRWLESHGFGNVNVAKSRTTIEFSGNAAQVQQAFHTAIHQYEVNGEMHWANSTDPSLPAAVAPVVAGVASLHNFRPKRQSRVQPAASRVGGPANPNSAHPQVTFTTNTPCALTSVLACFGLGPTDFATIYNVLPLWNSGIDGTGETIAILNDSNINIQDDRDFRSIFGLPAKDPVITVNGSDPGKTDDEVEAILDVEWSGAVAKNATINLIVSASTNATFGGDLSATFAVNEAAPPPIISESFGQCELFLGTTENAFLNSTWKQAATEGISVVVSSGDDGAAGCDFVASNSPLIDPAQGGLAVNGLASTPYDTAVGGTEFNDVANPTPFWNSTNATGTQASAIGYIPEMTYNDSCTATAVINFFSDPDAFSACNDGTVQAAGFVEPSGGSGGKSSCIGSDGTNVSSCTGGYAKPSWQAIPRTPNDGVRDVPDVSLFAGDSTISGSFYVLCERDFSGINGAACNLNNSKFLFAGGTSVSAQVFAGIVALLDQKYEDKQGLLNPTLYNMAAANANNCASVANPVSTCVFYDITTDTIAMPCDVSLSGFTPSPNCTSSGGEPIGVLTGYAAGAGYDLATGLGSINAANLVASPSVWATNLGGDDFSLSVVGTPAVTIASGGQGNVTLLATADGGFNGAVTASCPSAPTGVTCSGSLTLGTDSFVTIKSSSTATLAPTGVPARVGPLGTGALVAFFSMLGLVLFLMHSSGAHRRRLRAALAMAAFAVVIAAFAGCGGGSGGGGGGGGGGGFTGTTNLVVTATSGSIQRSVVVTLTVN